MKLEHFNKKSAVKEMTISFDEFFPEMDNYPTLKKREKKILGKRSEKIKA